MRQKRRSANHAIDLLFPIALLFAFAVCAVMVVFMSAKIYQSTVQQSSMNYTARTSLAYITEKIHQNDIDGAVYLGTFDGCDALVMERDYEGEHYYTYIYVDDQELKELYLKDGADLGRDNGHRIIPVQEFSMEEISDHLYRFACTDEDGQTSSVLVGVRSVR